MTGKGKKKKSGNWGADCDPNCTVHETMLGLTKTDAGSDLVSRQRMVGTKREQDVEEWAGIGS